MNKIYRKLAAILATVMKNVCIGEKKLNTWQKVYG